MTNICNEHGVKVMHSPIFATYKHMRTVCCLETGRFVRNGQCSVLNCEDGGKKTDKMLRLKVGSLVRVKYLHSTFAQNISWH